LLGRLFRSESTTSEKKNLVVFVTPTIIDPAGNRVHDKDHLPYDPNNVPVQPPSTIRPYSPPPAAAAAAPASTTAQ
jgi:type II secretory pathway component GspD/PulD (secretin)